MNRNQDRHIFNRDIGDYYYAPNLSTSRRGVTANRTIQFIGEFFLLAYTLMNMRIITIVLFQPVSMKDIGLFTVASHQKV